MSILAAAVPVGEALVYGPVMLIGPDFVERISARLSVAEDVINSAWEAVDRSDAYPNAWTTADDKQWAIDSYRQFAGLLRNAAVSHCPVAFAIV